MEGFQAVHIDIETGRLAEYDGLEKLVAEYQKELQNLEYKGLEYASYYFFSQDIVLAAVSNSSALDCSDSWLIFFLTLLPTIVCFLAFFLLIDKYKLVSTSHDKVWNDYQVPEDGLYITFLRHVRRGSRRNYGLASPARRRRHLILVLGMVILVAYSVLLLSSPWTIVCKHDMSRRLHHQ